MVCSFIQSVYSVQGAYMLDLLHIFKVRTLCYGMFIYLERLQRTGRLYAGYTAYNAYTADI